MPKKLNRTELCDKYSPSLTKILVLIAGMASQACDDRYLKEENIPEAVDSFDIDKIRSEILDEVEIEVLGPEFDCPAETRDLTSFIHELEQDHNDDCEISKDITEELTCAFLNFDINGENTLNIEGEEFVVDASYCHGEETPFDISFLIQEGVTPEAKETFCTLMIEKPEGPMSYHFQTKRDWHFIGDSRISIFIDALDEDGSGGTISKSDIELRVFSDSEANYSHELTNDGTSIELTVNSYFCGPNASELADKLVTLSERISD
ncbi:hypothetical protein GF354_05995 [Candidatus Peregrinibacteria bacterium]|nr:hypothetical protein [Candidatus Peregrinibacteria bacterium]